MVSFLVGQKSGFCVGSDFSIDGGLRANSVFDGHLKEAPK